MQTSLIITTYNWPQALNLVLSSVLSQSVLPDQVIIADDGSTVTTRAVIEKHQQNFPVPLIHAWQEDEGFRVARVRNLGASLANGNYLIFVDGDMILHRHFIMSHLRHKKSGRFLHGPRVLLSNQLTEEYMTSMGSIKLNPLLKGVTNRLNAIHFTAASRILSGNDQSWRSRACNLSIHKDDFAKVNGFNEDFIGWGMEDSELAWRLKRAGIRKYHLRFCGVAYHLGHSQSNERTHNEEAARNALLLKKVIDSNSSWCERGLSDHLTSEALQNKTEHK